MYVRSEILSLFEFNLSILKTIFDLLEISPTITSTESYLKNYLGYTDLRSITPKKTSPSTPVPLYPPYTQVFTIKHGFISNLGIIDLLFNLGPESVDYLKQIDY